MTSSMELVLTSIGIQNELIVITTEMLALMRGGFNSINISCIFTYFVNNTYFAHVIITSTQIGDLKIHVTPKVVPSVLL